MESNVEIWKSLVSFLKTDCWVKGFYSLQGHLKMSLGYTLVPLMLENFSGKQKLKIDYKAGKNKLVDSSQG